MRFLDFFLRFLRPTPSRLRRRARWMRVAARRHDRKGRTQRASHLYDWANDLLEEANVLEDG